MWVNCLILSYKHPVHLKEAPLTNTDAPPSEKEPASEPKQSPYPKYIHEGSTEIACESLAQKKCGSKKNRSLPGLVLFDKIVEIRFVFLTKSLSSLAPVPLFGFMSIIIGSLFEPKIFFRNTARLKLLISKKSILKKCPTFQSKVDEKS